MNMNNNDNDNDLMNFKDNVMNKWINMNNILKLMKYE